MTLIPLTQELVTANRDAIRGWFVKMTPDQLRDLAQCLSDGHRAAVAENDNLIRMSLEMAQCLFFEMIHAVRQDMAEEFTPRLHVWRDKT